MANAGKIMIMPKGAYDASASYEVLDLVTHKGNVWVAKRNVAGVEPSEANSADWFLMADLAKYLPLDGSVPMSGELRLQKADNGYSGLRKNNSSTGDYGTFFKDVSGDGSFSQIVMRNNNGTFKYERFDSSGTKTGEYPILHTGNGLPLSGGTVNGNLTLDNGSASAEYHIKRTTTNAGNVVSAQWVDKYDAIHHLRVKRENDTSFSTYNFGENGFTFKPKDANDAEKTFLHTGNKPTGSYTGNGSATSRTISTGGLGSACIVMSPYWGKNALVLPYGVILFGTGGAIEYVHGFGFADGNLTIATDNSGLNSSGVTYYYQVL